jgi:hypothetical protein
LFSVREFKIEVVRNYFNYFTEIEERFQQRRGDFAAFDAGLGADRDVARGGDSPGGALRGIDAAFDKYEHGRSGPACSASTAWRGAHRR